MSLVIPTSKEIRNLVDALKEINTTLQKGNDISQARLEIEIESLRLQRYDHFAAGFVFTARFENQIQKGITMLQLTDIQKCQLNIQPIDAAGNAAPVDGVPEWSVSDGSIAELVVSADGMSATVSANGPLGTTQVNVTADADLGAGITTITGTLDVTVVPSQATNLNVATGIPEPK